MIYLLDSKLSEKSHSKYICDIITKHTDTQINLIEIDVSIDQRQLFYILESLLEVVTPIDIVLCPWVVSADDELDELFSQLAFLCSVVVSAGNFTEPLHKYSPARNPDVITVGTLNKRGLIAALSNFSNTKDKEIKWVPGTNYDVGWRNASGTSVSAALYAAFLAEAIKSKDMTVLDKLIEKQKQLVFEEIYHEKNK